MPDAPASPAHRERLLPSAAMFIVTAVFLIPAVTLVLTPINGDIALFGAIGVYLVIALLLVLMSPSVRVEDGALTAGRAWIQLDQLGETTVLEGAGLKRAIGTELDARAHLVVRGWIKRAVKVENIDPADPAPYWVITTRRPEALTAALKG